MPRVGALSPGVKLSEAMLDIVALCPVCGVDLDPFEVAASGGQYLCPYCCTRQKPMPRSGGGAQPIADPGALPIL